MGGHSGIWARIGYTVRALSGPLLSTSTRPLTACLPNMDTSDLGVVNNRNFPFPARILRNLSLYFSLPPLLSIFWSPYSTPGLHLESVATEEEGDGEGIRTLVAGRVMDLLKTRRRVQGARCKKFDLINHAKYIIDMAWNCAYHVTKEATYSLLPDK